MQSDDGDGDSDINASQFVIRPHDVAATSSPPIDQFIFLVLVAKGESDEGV